MILTILEILLRATILVTAIIALTRANGLRSFSKMSSFDFAITVACGSIIASSVITASENLVFGLSALVALFLVQRLISKGRIASGAFCNMIENAPLLVMKDGEILHDNLHAARMSETDLYGKLREANAYDISSVLAVVLEPTGDISVLHAPCYSDTKISPEILASVQT